MNKRILSLFVCFFVSAIIPLNVFGQESNSSYLHQNNNLNPTVKSPVNSAAFPNPVLLDSNKGCGVENLSAIRFDNSIDANQRVFFCEALQEISSQLNGNWSPALKSEIQEVWQVLSRENVKIFPMKKDVSAKVVAAEVAFPNNESGAGFNAGLHLRIDKAKDKSFFLAFMHEARHVYDYYEIWKNRSNLTESELEKRGFRIMSKLYQEMPDKERLSKMPSFWKDDWKNLSPNEIAAKREEKIENFMRGNKFYKHLLKSPEKYMVGFTDNPQSPQKPKIKLIAKNTGKESVTADALPARLVLNQTREEIPQQIKEISFTPEKPVNKQNSDELLRAAIANEKNLYRKMDNFVYDQTFQLQCWKKKSVSENFEMTNLVARTQSGETLFQNVGMNYLANKLPSCVVDFDSIKTDAAETFWAASYLDQMPVQFVGLTTLDGIPVARYTVLQPSNDKFKQIAKLYPQIKNFRVFVGTIFVSVEDAQIIKFWGTSFPKVNVTGSQKINADYSATAIRQKLATGIWVTTLLNTVAIASENDKVKPYSYIAKYNNYRQAVSDVVILEDDVVAAK